MRLTRLVACVLLLSGPLLAQEQVNLTTPVTRPSTTLYRVTYVAFDFANSRISIELTDDVGNKLGATYEGATATTLMLALNKTDLSVQSLQRRILARLIADGKLAGTISGSPQ